MFSTSVMKSLPNKGLILAFICIYALLVGYTRSICWKDPTSKFFQAERAHSPTYSAHRIQQAEQYANSIASQQRERGSGSAPPPELCIGAPSVQRNGISYLKLALGSLQHSLSPEERAGLVFVVLLAHTNQSKHPAYGQPWLESMADRLPTYHDNPERLALARSMELNQTHGRKAKFDYSIVMEECAKTGAPYILMVEDDVIALDGWLHRTLRALEVATTKTWEAGHSDFLYLRLFYYEGLLGWNTESWPTYFRSSFVITAGILGSLLLTRRYSATARPHLTRFTAILVTFIFTPHLILLFFAAGRNCVLPQPAGVHLMHEYACCGQGLVFPRTTVVDKLLLHFHANRWSEVPTDSFVEEYADAAGALRWALTPVVLQHVGGRSSHGANRGTLGDMMPSLLWNFGFEGNDAASLAAEHSSVNSPII